jgi:hypothetical protein
MDYAEKLKDDLETEGRYDRYLFPNVSRQNIPFTVSN